MAGFGRVAAGIGAALLLAFGSPAEAAPGGSSAQANEPRPAIWLLEDEDTKIYLFGTIHILPAGLNWRSEALERIIAKAGELVVEDYAAPGDTARDAEAAATFLRSAPSPILERVPEDRREALRTAIEAGPIPLEAYDMMHSWAAAMTLGMAGLFGDYGLGGDELDATDANGGVTGVEVELEQAFRAAGKPIRGVENSLNVLRELNTLPSEVQDRLLLEAIGQESAASATFDAGLAAWIAGKAERMTIGLEELPPQMHHILLRKRNIAWTGWLIERLERPGAILFAVGAGHLAGPDSVQRLLAERGYRARRIH